MNLEKVIFGFFVLLAATLNLGFFVGDISNPDVHNIYELFAALAVSLIATVLKFGDRTQIGAVHLATSLVADLQLIAASIVLVWAEEIAASGVDTAHIASVVSLSCGALLANLVSHVRHGEPLLVPLAHTGAFTRFVEAVRTAPEPRPLPASAWHTERTDSGPRRVVPGIDALTAEGARRLALYSELGVHTRSAALRAATRSVVDDAQ